MIAVKNRRKFKKNKSKAHIHTMDPSSESFFADQGDSIFSSKSRRPTTSSLGLGPNFGKHGSRKLGRTKSLLLLGRADTSLTVAAKHKSARMEDYDDDSSLGTLRDGEHQTRYSSLRHFINRTGQSFRSRTPRREQSASHHSPETSKLQRLRHAVGFRSSKCEPVQEREKHDDSEEVVTAPVPGNGNEPPVIPELRGGMAARANAAASNQVYWQTRRLVEDSQGDRESGIGITSAASAASTTSLQQESPVADSVTRVDFMERLPSELASQVLSHLNLQSLKAVELVSRRWNLVASDSYIWRDVFYQDKSATVATGKPIVPGTGHGLPDFKPSKDWRKVYKVRQQLERNWSDGYAQATYLHGHQDSIYCLQFDE